MKVSVDGNMPSGDKRGKACATTYAGMYAFGDASVKEAAKDGGITRVEAVEAEINSRIVIGTYCTIVHGR